MDDLLTETATVRTRRFGRLGWEVSEIGYGMWGIAGGEGGWTGSDDQAGMASLHLATDMGCNFFDTAWIYGRGSSEKLLGRLLRERAGETLYVATKIPPKNRTWPSRGEDRLQDLFPRDFLDEYLHKSLDNLGIDCVDLIQFHVWEDHWAEDGHWQEAVRDWKSQGLIKGVGLSVNRWEPENCLKAVETGLIDSIQVIYNIFDQAPEDKLFPACQKHDVAVIARVPFDEGTLTGTLREDTVWPEGDWRTSYFVPENLKASVARAEALRPDLPTGMDMPEAALRFILHHEAVCTTIPGMRRASHVRANLRASDGLVLSPGALGKLRPHRWDRTPTAWSQ